MDNMLYLKPSFKDITNNYMLTLLSRLRVHSKLGKYAFSAEKLAPGEQAEPGFLQMVEAFFDKAASNTDISKDRLDFYKKSESLVKIHLTLIRGFSYSI
jgi:hypothetical protein